MSHDEEQLEIKLDEELDNARLGIETNSENRVINELAEAGENFISAVKDEAAHASFVNLLKKLPVNSSSEPAKQKLKNNSKIFNFNLFNFKNMKMPKIFALRSLGTALAVVMLLIGGLNVVKTVLNAGNPNANFGLITANIPSSGGGLQLQSAELGAATGLAAPSYSNPVAKAVNTVSGFFKPTPEPDYYPIRPPQPDYTTNDARDTREYLKVSYSARIKTRHPDTQAERAQITILGLQGRVDSSNISETNSYIYFVIPKSNLDALRNEVKTYASAKFISENISSQNLLPQKQQIEGSTDQVSASLAKLENDKSDLTNKHIATLASLNQQLNYAIAELNKLEKLVPIDYVSPEDKASLEARKAGYRNQISALRKSIASENTSYQSQLASFDNQIQYLNNQLNNLAKQDVNLGANVETVQGSLSFTKITYWGMLDVYLGGYATALVWIIIGCIIYYLSRRDRNPEIQPVQ